jgi:hypothetical protein
MPIFMLGSTSNTTLASLSIIDQQDVQPQTKELV